MAVVKSDVVNWLKIIYANGQDLNKDLVDGRQSPVLSMILKNNQTMNITGDEYHVPIRAGGKRSSGKDFATVQARANAGQTGTRLKFIHDMDVNFERVEIERQAMLRSKDLAGAFGQVLLEDIEQAKMSMYTDLVRGLYGSGGEYLARINGSPTTTAGSGGARGTTLLEVDDESQTLQFERNQWIEFSSDSYKNTDDNRRQEVVGTTTHKVFKILKVDHEAKQITVEGVVAAIADNDYIWREGDYNVSVDPDTRKNVGILDYIPSTVTSDLFLNVDRTISPRRLAGWYKALADVQGKDVGEVIYDGIIDACVGVNQFFPEYKVDFMVANPKVFGALQKSSIFKEGVRWVEEGTLTKRTGAIGFSGFYVLTPKGNVPLMFDPHCPTSSLLGLNSKSWYYRYLSERPGNIIDFQREGGDYVLLSRTANTNEVRLESYNFLACNCPGSNFRLDLGSLTGL